MLGEAKRFSCCCSKWRYYIQATDMAQERDFLVGQQMTNTTGRRATAGVECGEGGLTKNSCSTSLLVIYTKSGGNLSISPPPPHPPPNRLSIEVHHICGLKSIYNITLWPQSESGICWPSHLHVRVKRPSHSPRRHILSSGMCKSYIIICPLCNLSSIPFRPAAAFQYVADNGQNIRDSFIRSVAVGQT